MSDEAWRAMLIFLGLAAVGFLLGVITGLAIARLALAAVGWFTS